MTSGCASSGSGGGPLDRTSASEAAWVVGPEGAFEVDLRTGARGGNAPLPPAGEMRRVLIPGFDVPFVLDPSRRVFVPLERARGKEDRIADE